jgi:hypothetical protein
MYTVRQVELDDARVAPADRLSIAGWPVRLEDSSNAAAQRHRETRATRGDRDMSMLSTEHLARISALHPWRVLGLWGLVFVGAIAILGTAFAGALTTEFRPTNNPARSRRRR